MTWFQVDDGITEHPKLAAAGPLAGWLYIAGLAYCSRNLTDGFIPERTAGILVNWSEEDAEIPWMASEFLNAERNGHVTPLVTVLVTRLLRVTLWEKVDGGYRVHDYLKHQRSKEQVLKERASNKARQARFREQKQPESNAVSNAVSNAAQSQSHIQRQIKKEDTPNGVSKKVLTKEQEPRFTVFWDRYPRREGKGAAEKAWMKIKPPSELVEEMLTSLDRWKLCPQWQDSQFIPYPQKWLSERRWEDEPPLERSTNGTSRQSPQTNTGPLYVDPSTRPPSSTKFADLAKRHAANRDALGATPEGEPARQSP